jgi:hypothetical protein
MEPENETSRHPNPIGSPVEETATEARQGRKGTPVLKVLVVALILAALAWGAAEWWGESTDPPAEQTATPPAGEATPGNSGPAPSPATGNEPVTQPNAPTTNDRPSGNP